MCHYKNAIQCIAKSIERFQLSLFLFIYLFNNFFSTCQRAIRDTYFYTTFDSPYPYLVNMENVCHLPLPKFENV